MTAVVLICFCNLSLGLNCPFRLCGKDCFFTACHAILQKRLTRTKCVKFCVNWILRAKFSQISQKIWQKSKNLQKIQAFLQKNAKIQGKLSLTSYNYTKIWQRKRAWNLYQRQDTERTYRLQGRKRTSIWHAKRKFRHCRRKFSRKRLKCKAS